MVFQIEIWDNKISSQGMSTCLIHLGYCEIAAKNSDPQFKSDEDTMEELSQQMSSQASVRDDIVYSQNDSQVIHF